MNYVFFGSPIFARLVLEQLVAANMPPRAVICNPDRPTGRRQVVTPPEVKKYILEKNLPIEILQPEDPSLVRDRLSLIAPDFFVVAAYGKILKKELLDIPRLGTLGIHSSLLPKYRGTSPIHGTILSGETETGATIYVMDDKMDHGAILAQFKTPISDRDTHETLVAKIWTGGGKALAKLLPEYIAGKIKPRVQDESQATYTKKFTTQDGYIDPKDLEAALSGNAEKSVAIDRKIRAFGVEPGVWTKEWHAAHRAWNIPASKRVKLLEAEIFDGKLILKKIQIEGEKPRMV
jgi:methionyl-tRNA formyltransferase